uniref:Cl33166_-1a n=1 Tax=Arundo donax TaxID=35708 RepID=A0A0A9HGY5_ARUDO
MIVCDQFVADNVVMCQIETLAEKKSVTYQELHSCVSEGCRRFPSHGDSGRTAERTCYELHSGMSGEATYQPRLVKCHTPRRNGTSQADTLQAVLLV